MRGRSAQLERAVTNLMTNADKFSPPGTPIDVTVEVDGGTHRSRLLEALDGLPAIADMNRQPQTSFGAADLQLEPALLRQRMKR